MTRSVKIVVFAFSVAAALALVFALTGSVQLLTFWPIESAADFAQRITPLFLVALFVERAIEVFVSPWRAREETILKEERKTEPGQKDEANDHKLKTFKYETQKLTFTAAVSVGIVVAAVGIRALALFIYPDQIEALVNPQRTLFTTVDVLITGLVIGGGADGIHKVVKVFTSFFDSVSATNEEREKRERRAPAPANL